MATFRSSLFLTAFGVMTLCAGAGLGFAQTLTPGAAAIGGTTGSGDLIAPGGSSVAPSTGSAGNTGSTRPQTGSSGPRKHYPSSNWILSNPPIRTQVRGTPIASFPGDANDLRGGTPISVDPDTQTAAVEPTTPVVAPADTFVEPADPPASDLTPVFVPETPSDELATTPTQTPASEAVEQPATSTQPDTTAVTAGATDETAPTQGGGGDLAPAAVSSDFDLASLPFGISDTELTPDHIFRLEPVIALMRAEPLTPLNVVAVIAQVDGDNEDVKLLARKRILAVRRHILSQGVSSDRLTFKITATAATEQFANHVLIQR